MTDRLTDDEAEALRARLCEAEFEGIDSAEADYWNLARLLLAYHERETAAEPHGGVDPPHDTFLRRAALDAQEEPR